MGTFKIYRQYDTLGCSVKCLNMMLGTTGGAIRWRPGRVRSGINREGMSHPILILLIIMTFNQIFDI
ncbi:hypothetical protein Asal01_00989 [Fodinibius salicampi]